MEKGPAATKGIHHDPGRVLQAIPGSGHIRLYPRLRRFTKRGRSGCQRLESTCARELAASFLRLSKQRRDVHMNVINTLGLRPMDSTSASSGSTSSSSSSTSSISNDLSTSSFMTLLSAELQNQDPTQPVDPTEFVSQLAQLTELQSVTQIQTSVSQIAASVAANQASGTSGGTSN